MGKPTDLTISVSELCSTHISYSEQGDQRTSQHPTHMGVWKDESNETRSKSASRKSVHWSSLALWQNGVLFDDENSTVIFNR